MQNILFQSDNEYRLHRNDLSFWKPYITHILERHDFQCTHGLKTIKCGDNSTYPVFLINDLVIKFFGHRPNWSHAFFIECEAHDCLAQDATIKAPHILAKGNLFDDPKAPWSYIISTKVTGQPWLNTPLTFDEKNSLAAEIGGQLQKIHSLALYRQAAGLTQHSSFDVFYKLPTIVSLDDVKTLNELAKILFEI